MIHDYLSLLDQTSENYKTIVYDPDGIENPTVNTTQDINRGGFHNALEYLSRWKNRTKTERSLQTATGILLDAWGKLFGINRNSEIDQEYRDFILEKIFPPQFTIAWLREQLPGVSVLEANETGFFLDDGYIDDSKTLENNGATLTALSNAIYINFEEATDVDWPFILSLGRIRPAGIAIYVGWAKSGIYEYLHLSDGYLNDDFVSDQDTAILNPQNEPELTYLSNTYTSDSHIGEQ